MLGQVDQLIRRQRCLHDDVQRMIDLVGEVFTLRPGRQNRTGTGRRINALIRQLDRRLAIQFVPEVQDQMIGLWRRFITVYRAVAI